MVNANQTPGTLTNTDVLVIAVWKAGGAGHFIDIEDAYAVCWELAPQRFSWRTRKEFPNTAVLSKTLRDLTRRTDKPLVKQGFYKVRLSQAGIEWVETHGPMIATLTETKFDQVLLSSNQASRQLNRFKKSTFFERWIETGELSLERWELAAALRCSPNSSADIWRKRIETLKADAQYFNDQDSQRFFDLTLEEKSDWFEGD